MEDNNLIHAFIFDGNGGGQRLSWQEVAAWSPSQGTLWIHLAYDAPEAVAWIEDQAGLDPVVTVALLSEGTRPRSIVIGKGLLMTLREVNLNPGSDQEDMVSLRIWAEESRIVSTRKRPVLAITELAESLAAGRGPATSGEFIEELAELVTANIESGIDALQEQNEGLEERVAKVHNRHLRQEISAIRRKSILFHRYLAPQREALARLQAEAIPWISEQSRRRLHETTNTLIRVIEDLDSMHERALVAQEELYSLMSEQLNSRMYLLSLVTTIFLPLSFLTGLLGINVAGIPGADSPWAFLVVFLLILGVFLGQLLYYRKRQWI